MHPRVPASKLVTLPPLPALRSVHGHPPFWELLQWLEGQEGRSLGFLNIYIGTADYAALRVLTREWLKARGRLGLDLPADMADKLSTEGMTAPRLDRKLKPGQALIAEVA